MKRAYHRFRRLNLRNTLRHLLRPRGVFQERYHLENNTRVTVYTNNQEQFPGYQPLRPLHDLSTDGKVPVSLIATVKNESRVAAQWLALVLAGSRLPDEIIIVDAGSEDGTAEILRSAATQSPIPIKVIVKPGVNIAQGRNLAIENAVHKIIAVTDFGALPEQDWLQELVYPFEDDPSIQVVAGWYDAVDSQGSLLKRRSWPTIETVNPVKFIPSSRSLAFRKDRWKAISGYPEWLTLTGEDTYFAFELRQVSDHWAFVPGAVVQWQAPESLSEYWDKQYAWSTGDGESGINTKYYWLLALRWTFAGVSLLLIVLLLILGSLLSSWWFTGIAAVMLLLGALYIVLQVSGRKIPLGETFTESAAQIAQLLGFLRGARNRGDVDQRRQRGLAGCFTILSGVPIDDTGGGARCTQISLELLRRQYQVVFIHKFPKYESQELGITIRHPNLVTYKLGKASVDQMINRCDPPSLDKPCGVLVEFPLEDFLPLIKGLRERGCHVIYDLLDDWNTSLGGDWYSEVTEREIIDNADRLVATSPALLTHLQTGTGGKPDLVPNAVNLHIFNHRKQYPRPVDLPDAERTILYTGALWGDWFDWELLIEVCRAYPQASLVMIGDYRGQAPSHPDNLHFLGLKAQRDLPAYLAHADVTIIPWKSNHITHATSPLKVYEYVAMRKPVVAPNLPALVDIPNVLLAKDRQDFIAKINLAYNLQVDDRYLEDFIRDNSWSARVDQLLKFAW